MFVIRVLLVYVTLLLILLAVNEPTVNALGGIFTGVGTAGGWLTSKYFKSTVLSIVDD